MQPQGHLQVLMNMLHRGFHVQNALGTSCSSSWTLWTALTARIPQMHPASAFPLACPTRRTIKAMPATSTRKSSSKKASTFVPFLPSFPPLSDLGLAAESRRRAPRDGPRRQAHVGLLALDVRKGSGHSEARGSGDEEESVGCRVGSESGRACSGGAVARHPFADVHRSAKACRMLQKTVKRSCSVVVHVLCRPTGEPCTVSRRDRLLRRRGRRVGLPPRPLPSLSKAARPRQRCHSPSEARRTSIAERLRRPDGSA